MQQAVYQQPTSNVGLQNGMSQQPGEDPVAWAGIPSYNNQSTVKPNSNSPYANMSYHAPIPNGMHWSDAQAQALRKKTAEHGIPDNWIKIGPGAYRVPGAQVRYQ